MGNTSGTQSNNKVLFIILGIILLIAAGAIGFNSVHKRKNTTVNAEKVTIDGVYFAKPLPVKDFQMTDNTGKPFTKDNLNNHWSLLFFGFTNCGAVCPTTMAALNTMYQELQAQLKPDLLPQVVMISVDPQRDTVKRMDSYVKSYNPNFKGARGDQQHTDAMKKQFHIVSTKIQSKDTKNPNNYTVTHTADIAVLNPQGELVAYLSYPHTGHEMAQDYKTILSANNQS